MDPTAHRRLLSSDSSDSDNAAAMDVTADLACLRVHYSRLAAGPSVRPREVPALVARPDDPALAVSLLARRDLRPSCMLLALLPAPFPSHPAHARHELSAAVPLPQRPRGRARQDAHGARQGVQRPSFI